MSAKSSPQPFTNCSRPRNSHFPRRLVCLKSPAMLEMKLSTLSIILGLIVTLPSLFGLLKPQAYAEAARQFPRWTPVGYVLMLAATGWFLYYVHLESVADFAPMKRYFYIVFGGVGLGVCLFVRDFLPVRGLAVLFLLAAKLMVDSARWVETDWRLVIVTWAYVLAVVGMWFTISPWRCRDILNWSVATESRTRATNAARAAFGILVLVLGLTVFRAAEQQKAANSAEVAAPVRTLAS
jgi:hypothetical protein